MQVLECLHVFMSVCVCFYVCIGIFVGIFFLFVVDVKYFLSRSSILFYIKHGYLQGNNCFVFIY